MLNAVNMFRLSMYKSINDCRFRKCYIKSKRYKSINKHIKNIYYLFSIYSLFFPPSITFKSINKIIIYYNYIIKEGGIIMDINEIAKSF